MPLSGRTLHSYTWQNGRKEDTLQNITLNTQSLAFYKKTVHPIPYLSEPFPASHKAHKAHPQRQCKFQFVNLKFQSYRLLDGRCSPNRV